MDIAVNDVVQLDPGEHTHHNGFWKGQFLVVTEVKSWGVQGYAVGEGGLAFYRAKTGTFERIGRAVWSLKREGD